MRIPILVGIFLLFAACEPPQEQSVAQSRGLAAGDKEPDSSYFPSLDEVKLAEIKGANPKDFCSDYVYLDENGEEQKGTRDCSVSYETCESRGQVDCIANESLPAGGQETTESAPNSSNSVGSCSKDGQVACVAQKDFPAIDVSSVEPGSIKAGVKIAGVEGTFTGFPKISVKGFSKNRRIAGDEVKVKFIIDAEGSTGNVSLYYGDDATLCDDEHVPVGSENDEWTLIVSDLKHSDNQFIWRSLPFGAHYVCAKYLTKDGNYFGVSRRYLAVHERASFCSKESDVFVSGRVGCNQAKSTLSWSRAHIRRKSQNQARKYCSSLDQAEVKGWRLPTKTELLNLAKLGALNHLVVAKGMQIFWSSSETNQKKYFSSVSLNDAAVFESHRKSKAGTICVYEN